MCSNAMNARQATRTDSAPQIELPLCPLFNDQFFPARGWPLWTYRGGNQLSLDHFMSRYLSIPISGGSTNGYAPIRPVERPQSRTPDDPGNCLMWRIGHACPCANDAHRK